MGLARDTEAAGLAPPKAEPEGRFWRSRRHAQRGESGVGRGVVLDN